MLFSSKDNVKGRNVEWWEVKGYGFDIGVKYYLTERKYLSLRSSIDLYNFNGSFSANSERDEDQVSEKLNRNDFNFQVLYGKEKKIHKKLFSEIYFGIGFLFVFEERYVLEDSINPTNYHYLGMKYVNHSTNFFVPTFLFGYNIGLNSSK